MSNYDYAAFKKAYNLRSDGVPHIKAGWKLSQAIQALKEAATEYAALNEVGMLLIMQDFLESITEADKRIQEDWQKKMEEFKCTE